MKQLIFTILFLITIINLASGKVCPDQKSKCSQTATCCQTGSGYGCCPYPNANCCSDGLHCCPHGLTCDVEHGRCTSKFMFLNSLLRNSLEKIRNHNDLMKLTPGKDSNNSTLTNEIEIDMYKKTCPDRRQKCPNSYTCCPLTDSANDFACCPETDGICCSDHIHCCPKSSKCNISAGRCDKS